MQTVNSDEMAHYERSHLDLQCLQKIFALIYKAEKVKMHCGKKGVLKLQNGYTIKGSWGMTINRNQPTHPCLFRALSILYRRNIKAPDQTE